MFGDSIEFKPRPVPSPDGLKKVAKASSLTAIELEGKWVRVFGDAAVESALIP